MARTAIRELATPTGSSRPPFITVENVSKVYGTRSSGTVHAVETVSFDIGRGEFTSIVGPSGCGKSTLLKAIGGLLAPTGGRIVYHGLERRQTRPDLGIVFQDAVLLPWRTVLQIFCLPIEVMRLDRTEGEARARHLIELVGLEGFEGKYPSELSGGMQQRASIARALINEPSLLLMDEPFGALDALTRENMASELQRIWSASRKTVVFITHSIAEAVFLSDRVIVMSSRPSRIMEIIDIDLPRPRTVQSTSSAAFLGYVTRIRTLLSVTGNL